jgi:plastocyanin
MIAALVAIVAVGGPGEISAGGGCHEQAEVQFSDAAAASVAAGKCAFSPTVARVASGQEVTWLNKDPIPHTVTGAAGSFGDVKEYQEGESVTYRFDRPGVFPYFCQLHPGMVGAVVVGDAPAASAGDAGISAVSAVSGDVPDTAEAAYGATQGNTDGFSTGVIAAIALLIAALGAIGLAPIALRRSDR